MNIFVILSYEIMVTSYIFHFYKPVLFCIIRLSKNKTNQLTWPKCVPGPCAQGGIAASWKKILRAVWNHKITIIRLNKSNIFHISILCLYYDYITIVFQNEFCFCLRIVSLIFRQHTINHITFNMFATIHTLPMTHYTLIICL